MLRVGVACLALATTDAYLRGSNASSSIVPDSSWYYYTDWATGYEGSTTTNDLLLCDESTPTPSSRIVTKITGKYAQVGFGGIDLHGFVDVIVECANGNNMRSTWTNYGSEDPPVTCDEGFNAIQPLTQDTTEFIVNWQITTIGGAKSTSNQHFENWASKVSCNEGDLLVGMQTKTNTEEDDGGLFLADLRAVCSPKCLANSATGSLTPCGGGVPLTPCELGHTPPRGFLSHTHARPRARR